MSATRPQDALEALRDSAQGRHDAERAGKTRIVVQVGHCSQATGSVAVVEAAAASATDDAYVVVAGCDGACFDGPRIAVTDADGLTEVFGRVDPDSAVRIVEGERGNPSDGAEFFGAQRRIALDGCGEIDATGLDDYLLRGGYDGLGRALAMSPEAVAEVVTKAGLLGRGGAYFPAGAKWDSVRKGGVARYMVVNAEEGEPGVFKDRHLMEGVPHRLIEGMAIAAYASGVGRAYVYINAEADLSAERVEGAVGQAYESGLLGDNVLGSEFSLEVSLLRGAGGYVCGEETVLLNTMEGRRREPRFKPPYPTDSGLWARPTVVNNAETLANVPFILAGGAEAFAEIGSDRATGTKLVSLSGSVRRPGVAEVPMGTSLREIIEGLGGGPESGHTLTGVAVGGPSSGVLPPSMLDTAIAPGMLHESGVMLGAGGMVALDERAPVVEVVRKLAAYNADESCGKCTPCREGTPRIVDALDRLKAGGSAAELEELKYLAEVVGLASLCGLGQAAGGPINSGLHFFPDEFEALAGG
jgi:NADH:ubiquinone oxidoreductase subunit F (NADH-binding)/(2Fe-2S) ferredoxin